MTGCSHPTVVTRCYRPRRTELGKVVPGIMDWMLSSHCQRTKVRALNDDETTVTMRAPYGDGTARTIGLLGQQDRSDNESTV